MVCTTRKINSSSPIKINPIYITAKDIIVNFYSSRGSTIASMVSIPRLYNVISNYRTVASTKHKAGRTNYSTFGLLP